MKVIGGESLRKIVIAIALLITVLTGLFVALPVIAAPIGEQKVPVKVSFVVDRSKTQIIENITTPGNISHIVMSMIWNVNYFIGDSQTPITGTANVIRDCDYRYKKAGGVDQVSFDSISIVFTDSNRGFEGIAQSTITNYVKGPPTTYDIRVHVLLRGTGAYEGQTLNAWQTGGGTTALWEGYLLKPE